MLKTTSIIHLLVSKNTPSGTYIIVGDANGVIEVLVNKSKKFVPHITLPKYQCVPTAMTVDDDQETLIVVYSDQTVSGFLIIALSFLIPILLGQVTTAALPLSKCCMQI